MTRKLVIECVKVEMAHGCSLKDAISKLRAGPDSVLRKAYFSQEEEIHVVQLLSTVSMAEFFESTEL